MKRFNNLFDKIVSLDNLYLADSKARRNKGNRKEIREFDKHKDELLLKLQQQLINGKYNTSEYFIFKIYEPKEREIFKLPYYPDRIVHHAIMNIMEPLWVSMFIKGTYSCIKKRGIHKALRDVKTALKDKDNTKYCLKLDVRKFYPSIDHDILKQIIGKKIKDKRLLDLLYNIIDSADGVPIGNYLSQFFANLYLTYMDHWIKEVKKIKYYFRYADDIVILHGDKQFLRDLFQDMKQYLNDKLHLDFKSNWQIFEVDDRGIDFVGYRTYHSHVLLRKRIKKNFCRKIAILNKRDMTKEEYLQKICSYVGWIKYCNGRNLFNKVIKYKELLDYISINNNNKT